MTGGRGREGGESGDSYRLEDAFLCVEGAAAGVHVGGGGRGPRAGAGLGEGGRGHGRAMRGEQGAGTALDQGGGGEQAVEGDACSTRERSGRVRGRLGEGCGGEGGRERTWRRRHAVVLWGGWRVYYCCLPCTQRPNKDPCRVRPLTLSLERGMLPRPPPHLRGS